MITNDKLDIFENFIVDTSLKKVETTAVESSGFLIASGFSDSISRVDGIRTVDYLRYVYQNNSTIINWLKFKLAKFFYNKDKEKTFKKYQLINDFFNDIKTTLKQLNIDENRADFYIKAIENANANGQVALKEVLSSKLNGLTCELKLYKEGVVKYVDETDIVKLFQQYKIPKKILKLTWLKNYVRVIPPDVIEKKKIFDTKFVFDNYVVLHFDKDGTSTEMTNKEKEKAKDPILFGVVRESRKLFYVGDWIDEHCDLTMEKLLEELELKSVRQLSQKSIEKETLKS